MESHQGLIASFPSIQRKAERKFRLFLFGQRNGFSISANFRAAAPVSVQKQA